MVVWLIKEVFYQRKRHYLTIIASCIAIVLVLLVNIISSFIIENVNLSFEQLGLNISCIQLLEKRNDNWIDSVIEIYDIRKYSSYKKIQGRDYKVIGCNSNLSKVFTFNFERGHFLTPTGNRYNDNQIVIGSKLKHYFNCYQLNDFINFNGITFQVVGILEKDNYNLYEDFDDCVFIFEGYVKDYTQSGLYFVSNKVFDESYISELLGEDNYFFIDQRQTKDSLIALLNLIRNVLLALSFVSVVVSIICIVNNSLSNIYSRMKEIGIKKALGASNEDIYRQFILESILIFLISIVISCLIVLAIIKLINLTTKNEVEIDFVSNIKYITLILIIASSCNIYPAKKASEITIIETIKNNEFS